MKIKLPLCILGLLCCSLLAHAQNNLAVNYNPHWNLQGSRQLPSKLGHTNANVQLALLNPYLYGSNSAISFRSATRLSNQEINQAVNKLNPLNVAGLGADIDLLGLSFMIIGMGGERFTLSFMVTERMGANMLVSRNLMRLLWKGNKQFAGQLVDLSPMAINYTYFREYAIGTAIPVTLGLPESFHIRFGARVKYLQGYAAVHMPKSTAHLYTHPEGRYIDFDLDYQLYTAVEDDLNLLSFYDSPLGQGIGTDLGVTLNYNHRLAGSISLLDAGFIHYRDHTKHYSVQGKVHYDGLNISNIFGSPNFDVDSALFAGIKGDEQHGSSFRMPTSTRLLLQGEYKVPARANKDRLITRSTVFFTYIQGLNNLPGSTTRPFAAVGYSHSFGNVLNLGTSVAYGGYNRLALGAFGSLRMGPWRVGLGSNNLTGLVARNYGTGADFSMNMGVGF